MSDIFDDKDAIFVLEFYEKFNLYAHTTIMSADKRRLTKLVRMGVVFSVGGDKYCLKLNKDHPNVKAIIEAMELL